MKIMFAAESDAKKLPEQVGRVEDCARLVRESNDAALSGKRFTKEILQIGGEHGVAEALLYKKKECCVPEELISKANMARSTEALVMFLLKSHILFRHLGSRG